MSHIEIPDSIAQGAAKAKNEELQDDVVSQCITPCRAAYELVPVKDFVAFFNFDET